MNISKPKEHRAWRPRMSPEHEFNPFTSSINSDASFNRRSLDEIDEESLEPEAPEDEAQSIKIRGD